MHDPTAVPPYRIKAPLLLGGPHASMLEPDLKGLGFDTQIASAQLGVASATKMCRSVLVKGLEAMVIESFTAARRYGVEEAMIASLRETFPGGMEPLYEAILKDIMADKLQLGVSQSEGGAG